MSANNGDFRLLKQKQFTLFLLPQPHHSLTLYMAWKPPPSQVAQRIRTLFLSVEPVITIQRLSHSGTIDHHLPWRSLENCMTEIP